MSIHELDINYWIEQLGVLPISLFPERGEHSGQYIMLNGQHNNFCVDYASSLTAEEYKSYAWSSGVDNFIVIEQEKILLYKWSKERPEIIDARIVDENIHNFYSYLGKKTGPPENSIVPFTLRIFNKLRNSLRDESGEAALKAFLYLLAFLEESIDKNSYYLKSGKEIVEIKIDKYDWDLIVREFKLGVRSDNLRPNIKLLLRHTAGRLFEEAHFAAYLNSQLDIFGPSGDVVYKSRTPQQYGAYFTPSFIARSVVEEILRSYVELPKSLTIFDPACGSSEFLIEALRQLKRIEYDGEVKVIGWDISESAIDISTFILNFELRNWNGNATFELQKRDSLDPAYTWPDSPDIILMNPPFKSWELMNSDPDLRERVKGILGEQYSKNPNLAAAFLWLAVNHLKSDGKVGCLIPSAILSSDSHLAMRKELAEMITPTVIGRLGSFVFENALVDACLLIANKGKEDVSTTILWTKNIAGVTSKALRELRRLRYDPNKVVNEEGQYSIYQSLNNYSNASNWMPVSYSAAHLKNNVELLVRAGALNRVKDLFKVHRGIDPGRKYFKIDKTYFEVLTKREQAYFRPCADGRAIKNGRLKLKEYMFYPNTKGLKPINSEEDLMSSVPTFYQDVLLVNKADLQSRKISNRERWWELQRHRPWQEEKFPKLVSAAYGKAGDYAFDDSGEFVVEQSCVWLPKGKWASDNIQYAYLAIFCSTTWNDLLAIYSKQLAGGEWYNLQTKHVQDIPIPQLFSELAEVGRLSDIGKRISSGGAWDSEELDFLVRGLYQL